MVAQGCTSSVPVQAWFYSPTQKGIPQFYDAFFTSLERVICDKTKESCARILIPHERSFILVLWQEKWLVGQPLLPKILGLTDQLTPLKRNADFLSIFARSASAATPSEKKFKGLTLQSNRKSTVYALSNEPNMNIVLCPLSLLKGLKNAKRITGWAVALTWCIAQSIRKWHISTQNRFLWNMAWLTMSGPHSTWQLWWGYTVQARNQEGRGSDRSNDPPILSGPLLKSTYFLTY